MAAHQSRTTVSLLFSLFILSSVSSSPRSSGVFLPSDSDKVSLDFYYESLCPFCARFITKFLVKLFDSDLISIVDLHLSPWGNAKIRGNSTFDCQHGPSECLLNTVEACAIDAWPELNEHFPFIYCVESLMVEGKHTEWKSCFEKLGLDPKPILDCYDSEYGKKLELAYAAETAALEPPHRYVPWVVVNGQPLYEDYTNFISYICKGYKGTRVLEACTRLVDNAIALMKIRRIHSVCYKEKGISSLLEQIGSAILSWTPRMHVAGLM